MRLKQQLPILLILFLWIAQGLSQTNFWRHTNGPGGGSIQSFAFDSSRNIFAGTISTRVYRSNNNGQDWSKIYDTYNPDNPQDPIPQIRVLVTRQNHIFIGNGDVFRSTDYGNTWTNVSTGFSVHSVQALAENSNSHIFAGTWGFGIYRSTDDGKTWTQCDSLLSQQYIECLASNSLNYLFAGTARGIFRSTNDGDTWSLVDTNGVYYMNIDSSGRIFAGSMHRGMHRSTNNGDSWMQINNGITDTSIRGLAVNSQGTVYALTYGGIFQTTDSGEHWSQLNTGALGNNLQSIGIDHDNTIYLCGGYEDIYRSTDNGKSWSVINNGFSDTEISAFIASPQNILIAARRYGGVFRSNDQGDTWVRVDSNLQSGTNFRSFRFNAREQLFGGTFTNGLMRSTDYGNHWTQVDVVPAVARVEALAKDSTGVLYAATWMGFFRSTDDGENWVQTNHAMTLTSLAINSNGQIFGGNPFSNRIYHSTDGGAHWTIIDSVSSTSYLRSLVISPNGYIFAGTTGGVYRSTDNGMSWVSTSVGLTSTYILEMIANSKGTIFTSTYGGGMFLSNDNGAHWTEINSGLSNLYVSTLTLNSTGVLFSGTMGDGVFRSNGSTLGVEGHMGTPPDAFKLQQNYPNPINPATTISYSLAKSSYVLLKIFDILGHELKTLVNAYQNAGYKSVRLNGNDLPSGIFFYRLEAGKFTETKKLLLIR